MTKPSDAMLQPATKPLVIAIAAFFGALFAAAALMWMWFGTKVFFDLISSGIAYCF